MSTESPIEQPTALPRIDAESMLTAEEREFVDTWDRHATEAIEKHGEDHAVLERITREWMAFAPVTKCFTGVHRIDDQVGAHGRIGLALADRQAERGNLETALSFCKWARVWYENDGVPEGTALVDQRLADLNART